MATNLSNQPDPLQELEKKIAKFPCKIISIFELRSNNINYSKEEKEGIAQTYWTTNNQESPPPFRGVEGLFFPASPPSIAVNRTIGLETRGKSWPIDARISPWNADADVKVDADAEDVGFINIVSHWRQQRGKIPAAPRIRRDRSRRRGPRLSSTWRMIILRDTIAATNGPWDGDLDFADRSWNRPWKWRD